MRRTRPHNFAFTLIEIMLALALAATVAAAMAVALSVVFKARRSAVEGLSTVRAARVTMDAIGRDLQAALPPPPPPTGQSNQISTNIVGAFTGTGTPGGLGGPLVTSTGTTSAAPGAGAIGGSTPGLSSGVGTAKVGTSSIGSNNNPAQDSLGSGLTFFNTADPTRPVDGGSDVQQVSFVLIPDATLQTDQAGSPLATGFNAGSSAPPTIVATPSAPDEGVLVRRVSRHLLASTVETPIDQVLCRHVRAFGLRYFDGTQWVDTWDSTTQQSPLPLAVEVTLQITRTDVTPPQGAAAQGKTTPAYNLVRVFTLPCAATPNSATDVNGATVAQ